MELPPPPPLLSSVPPQALTPWQFRQQQVQRAAVERRPPPPVVPPPKISPSKGPGRSAPYIPLPVPPPNAAPATNSSSDSRAVRKIGASVSVLVTRDSRQKPASREADVHPWKPEDISLLVTSGTSAAEGPSSAQLAEATPRTFERLPIATRSIPSLPSSLAKTQQQRLTRPNMPDLGLVTLERSETRFSGTSPSEIDHSSPVLEKSVSVDEHQPSLPSSMEKEDAPLGTSKLRMGEHQRETRKRKHQAKTEKANMRAANASTLPLAEHVEDSVVKSLSHTGEERQPPLVSSIERLWSPPLETTKPGVASGAASSCVQVPPADVAIAPPPRKYDQSVEQSCDHDLDFGDDDAVSDYDQVTQSSLKLVRVARLKPSAVEVTQPALKLMRVARLKPNAVEHQRKKRKREHKPRKEKRDTTPATLQLVELVQACVDDGMSLRKACMVISRASEIGSSEKSTSASNLKKYYYLAQHSKAALVVPNVDRDALENKDEAHAQRRRLEDHKREKFREQMRRYQEYQETGEKKGSKVPRMPTLPSWMGEEEEAVLILESTLHISTLPPGPRAPPSGTEDDEADEGVHMTDSVRTSPITTVVEEAETIEPARSAHEVDAENLTEWVDRDNAYRKLSGKSSRKRQRVSGTE